MWLEKWREYWPDVRDLLAFALGAWIMFHEAFIHDPPLDRPGLLIAAAALMGFGGVKWNGRHTHKK